MSFSDESIRNVGVRDSSKPFSPTSSEHSPHWLYSAAVQFPRAWHHSKRRCRWVGVKGNTRNGRRDPKSTSSRRFRKVRENTEAPIEGATCAWMVADEAVSFTRAFLTMW
ncbi:uncharacterized protein TNCV_3615551 [Trichonephila clavipes]|nr:uncharacterized protein TNCV_3615551 [Trichonephila clavipes]